MMGGWGGSEGKGGGGGGGGRGVVRDEDGLEVCVVGGETRRERLRVDASVSRASGGSAVDAELPSPSHASLLSTTIGPSMA